MKGKGRFFIGLAITLAVLVVGAVVVVMIQNQPGKVEPVTLNCVGGSEKTALMADPDVKRILQDKYGVTVNWRSMGSYDTVLQSSEQIKQRGYDCLWPSSASAQSVFNDRHSGQFPDLRAETVLQSPLVIYAGPQGTQALLKAGIVAERDGKYFVVNLKSLLLDHTLAGKTWQQLQAGNLRGPINISSTDPVKSNSGFTLAQLELMVVATHDITAPPQHRAGTQGAGDHAQDLRQPRAAGHELRQRLPPVADPGRRVVQPVVCRVREPDHAVLRVAVRQQEHP